MNDMNQIDLNAFADKIRANQPIRYTALALCDEVEKYRMAVAILQREKFRLAYHADGHHAAWIVTDWNGECDLACGSDPIEAILKAAEAARKEKQS